MNNSPINDIGIKAELFNSIAHLVRSLGEYPSAAKSRPRTLTHTVQGPHQMTITFNQSLQTVAFGSQTINFRGRPVMFKLLGLFLQAKSKHLDREQIMFGLYDFIDRGQTSTRYRDSIYANSLKMLSRLRRVLNTDLKKTRPEISWVVYDPGDESWHLHHPRV